MAQPLVALVMVPGIVVVLDASVDPHHVHATPARGVPSRDVEVRDGRLAQAEEGEAAIPLLPGHLRPYVWPNLRREGGGG